MFRFAINPPSSATARVGRHENFSNFSASRSRCIYTALAVIPSPEIKIWCLNYQGEITLNDPTKQDDKPCLPYALTLRAFQNLQRHTAHGNSEPPRHPKASGHPFHAAAV